MRGLVEKTDTYTRFLALKHHSIVEEARTEMAGFKPIEVTNPKKPQEKFIKWVKFYSGVEALVCKIEWRDTEDKYETRFQSWRIYLDADGTPAILELPFHSRASSRFMMLAENLDFTQPVEFSAWHDKQSDATAFNVKQNGVSVPQLYTKDDMGECPSGVKNALTGKWNFDAQNAYLHARMLNVVIPRVVAADNPMPSGVGLAQHTEEVAERAEPNGDERPVTLDRAIQNSLSELGYTGEQLNEYITTKYGVRCDDWQLQSQKVREETLVYLKELIAEKEGEIPF